MFLVPTHHVMDAGDSDPDMGQNRFVSLQPMLQRPKNDVFRLNANTHRWLKAAIITMAQGFSEI